MKKINFDNKKLFSVIGIGFGDEGKGLAVDYLSSFNQNSFIYRHSGGHQVGHSVCIDGKIHEFRHFGSGTLRNKPTVWSENCTVSPLQFEIEFKNIQNVFNITPQLYCDDKCPVTTLYDIAYNRAKENKYKTGSVGVGFAATLKRTELIPLYYMDLKNSFVLNLKLTNICNYYFEKTNSEGIYDLFSNELYYLTTSGYDRECFIEACKFLVDNSMSLNDFNETLYDTTIFEGNQGILLDKFHGFYPNVTYGFTTNRNVPTENLSTFYVTRCYATRHGFGPLLNENLETPNLINIEYEQNHLNQYQGNFRTAILDYGMVDYAIKCDMSYNKNKDSNLLITCLDQYINPKITVNDNIIDLEPSLFKPLVDNIFINNSPESKTVKIWI